MNGQLACANAVQATRMVVQSGSSVTGSRAAGGRSELVTRSLEGAWEAAARDRVAPLRRSIECLNRGFLLVRAEAGRFVILHINTSASYQISARLPRQPLDSCFSFTLFIFPPLFSDSLLNSRIRSCAPALPFGQQIKWFRYICTLLRFFSIVCLFVRFFFLHILFFFPFFLQHVCLMHPIVRTDSPLQSSHTKHVFLDAIPSSAESYRLLFDVPSLLLPCQGGSVGGKKGKFEE